MARTFAAAFAEVDGPEFDLAVGYSIAPREPARTDTKIESAFAGVGYQPIESVIAMLASRFRDAANAEEAVHDTFERLLTERPGVFRGDPDTWQGLLYTLSRYRLLELREKSGRHASIQGLQDVAGDAPFANATPVLAVHLATDEDARYEPRRNPGEPWTRLQMIGAAQRFRDHHGRPPVLRECKAMHGLPSPETIRRHFGSFREFILESGMTPTSPERRRRCGPVEAAKLCQAFRWRNWHWPSWREIQRDPDSVPSSATMIRYFGSTHEAEVQARAEAILTD